eukprot:TRINITY_DN3067_c0_g1_i6.p2 TRINITY_DN3067_c0_g1~~TRINITY_DN3067_c0_g1_i6.p2  ORF type:complete len:194 (-),score=37.96 TRINITY_DN3067_c0_g1_i6:84-665(-)
MDGLNRINMLDKVNVIIVSDHGMAQLNEHNVITLDDLIDINMVQIISLGPTTLLKPNQPETVDLLFSALTLNTTQMDVYKKEMVPSYLHFNNNRRIPDLVLIARPGWTITTRQLYTLHREQFTGGAHGYPNNLTEMRTIFVATGPAFKKQKHVTSFQNVDIYSLLEHIYQIKGAPNNGSLTSLLPLLMPLEEQ